MVSYGDRPLVLVSSPVSSPPLTWCPCRPTPSHASGDCNGGRPGPPTANPEVVGAAGVFSEVTVRERPAGSPSCSAIFFEAERKQARKQTVAVAGDSSCPRGAENFGRGSGGATATSRHRRARTEGLSYRGGAKCFRRGGRPSQPEAGGRGAAQ